MAGLKTPVHELRGVGPSTTQKLARIGVRTVLDLLSYFPIRHEDLRTVTPIDRLNAGTVAVIRGKLQLIANRRGFRRRRMSITEGLLSDRTGTVKLVWFNQPYLADQFESGDEVYVIGKLSASAYGTQIQAPLIERADDTSIHVGRIVPIYRLTAGLGQRQLRTIIHSALPYAAGLTEWIPDTIARDEKLLPLGAALREIHAPSSLHKLDQARERLKFGELLPYLLATAITGGTRRSLRAASIPFDKDAMASFVSSLPFRLTQDQRIAAWDILKDLGMPHPMHRLIEGDVGSGKTAVAAIAAYSVASAGMQTALLAPTDILARQHYQTFTRLFPDQFPVALLTGTQREWNLSPSSPTKRAMRASIQDGTIKVLIGTHAILDDAVDMPSLTLAIVDEQHRFGVAQRHTMQQKGKEPTVPHLLSMTATPIPRTLALTLFGDLSVSQLRTMPAGRTPVQTTLLDTSRESEAHDAIRASIARGEQAFVVCPLIEESDEGGIAAATSEFERLRTGSLSAYRVALLHGAVPAKEKKRVLDAFVSGTVDILVTTPVVEVGVDIPNATVMVIEGAERFGLAQLHQLRGRVGRSARQSRCFLISDTANPASLRRLQTITSLHDGFMLAEEDLKHRGPGDLYGIRQTGLPSFNMASLSDLELMKRVRKVAARLLAEDPDLSSAPRLVKKLDALNRTIHKE